jgi:hypothetical protein
MPTPRKKGSENANIYWLYIAGRKEVTNEGVK